MCQCVYRPAFHATHSALTPVLLFAESSASHSTLTVRGSADIQLS